MDNRFLKVRLLSLVLSLMLLAQVAQAEVREVSVSDVVSEFCTVIVSNEARYTELLNGCVLDTSHDTDTLKRCVAVHSSIVRVMNEFFELHRSLDVKNHYSTPYKWAPPEEAFARLGCTRGGSDPLMSDVWSCPGFSLDQIRIASREPICGEAFEAEDRISDRLSNVRRAFQLLTVQGLRTAPVDQSPVVEEGWSID